MSGGDMKISLDKLPIKRLDSIEESGIERFPPEIGYDERRLALIRRIDFTPVVEKDAKKLKSSKEAAAAAATTPWPWQSLVENLQLAHQELSVIIDLINTVEANDAVTVAGMTRPKQLPNEVLSDLAVSAATKLQCFRHLGRYFKQSAKALEQQVAREARFYGALIRLQQNWKVKRQRLAISAPGSEGFTIDLFDNLLSDSTAVFRPSSISTVRVDHDSAGMLTLQLPPKSCRSIQFGFVGDRSSWKPKRLGNNKVYGSGEHPSRESKKEANDEDVDKCIKETHSVLREIHRAIFDEQVFDLVNREAFYPSPGVNVTGIREDFIQLGIGQEASVFLSLVPFEQDADQMTDTMGQTQNGEGGILPSDAMVVRVAEEKHDSFRKNFPGLPNPIGCEIYLQQILHENVFVKAKDGHPSAGRSQVSGQQAGDGLGLLGHFSMTLAHRIFSKKVMAELENLVSGVPYLHLLSHPTWHSRTSSWSLFMKVPESILHAGRRTRPVDVHGTKNRVKSQFHTKVVVNDESISISGEGAPNVVGLFRGGSTDTCLMNQYDCDLADLPVILLQQVASQVIRWLHEEALIVGMKASRDFLGLCFQLEQGDMLSLVAHVDPNNSRGCISWWLVMEDGLMEDGKLHTDLSNGGSENKRFLGYLSPEALYSLLMDLVSLCSGSGSY
ncbi:mediator of RNA polymerase II transcription subunit 17 [Magnolia sinica]|uniref:mediator of RNA polymerase II transcription subunit 17 n=1 Tax=Magnolia sinica TaxID=86752 RepID=UPI002659CDF0|nr:mediator of RNA polymerase II transcription subunit 17 [Magnolia sinica]